MDRIPLINPKLIKVSAAAENTSGAVLRAEVVSSTPIKQTNKEPGNSPSQESIKSKHQDGQQQEYKVVLKVGSQQLETMSTADFKKGSHLELKVLPGPELRIINKAPENQTSSSQLTSSQILALQAKPLVQQLLADRIPQVQQQDLPNLIKQLSQIISSSPSDSPNRSPLSTAQKTTTPQAAANLPYQQHSKTELSSKEPLNSTSSSTAVDSTIEQLKIWMRQLPKGQDVTSSIGLRNALNNAGIQAETQLSELAQQSLNLPNKKSANSIFQQLQTLQKNTLKDPISNATPATQVEPKTDLASIVKRTAKALSDNSQQVLSSLIKAKSLSTEASIPITQSNTTASLTTSQWQNPLLNNALISLEDLLQAPLLQNPSSNNKFALSQILIGHTFANQGKQPDSELRLPLNWSAGSGNENPVIRNIQNLLGHIEREQIQQMQSTEANQGNSPNQLQQSQQWIPLLINHQQQLQLIEFFLDKEERINETGEKKQHWFINLHFDLPKLGKLGIEICMLDNECSTTFWSESAASRSQLTQHIQPLRERLTEQGIIVTDIQSRHGTLEKRKHNIQQRLIDVNT